MTLRVYRRLSSAMAPLAPALMKRRLKQGKEDPARIGERRGVSGDIRPHGPLVWIHGASVGEVLAAAGLIEKLRALNIRILLTSGTVTSAAIVAKRFPADIIHQYVPYDSPSYVARFLDHWRPSLALFIESDLWPNLILSSAARRLPMVLINGRMSHRSFPRWRRVSGTISALLGRFEVCLAQSRVDAERFTALGSRNVITTGNLKLDVAAPPADSVKLERLMSVTRGRPARSCQVPTCTKPAAPSSARTAAPCAGPCSSSSQADAARWAGAPATMARSASSPSGPLVSARRGSKRSAGSAVASSASAR
jgi:3-deoxy-D-manno-octulosonic-acid transferase